MAQEIIIHSFDRVGVLLSDEPMGLDIERLREKIVRIAPKFTPWQWQDKGLTQADHSHATFMLEGFHLYLRKRK